jgi:VIT1/CCC1 family predicted Fe2+/Mn2+ transporter
MKINRIDALQTELDAGWLYSRLALAEENEQIKKLFHEMSLIEHEHATHMFDKMKEAGLVTIMPGPSWRAKLLDRIGKWFGYDYVLGTLMDTEKTLALKQQRAKQQQGVELSGAETNHVRILQNLLNNSAGLGGSQVVRMESRHKSVGGNALRAAVLGANDGLVSNMSLVMGVAGATGGRSEVLLAGMAGLLAGALSMALGEWISVKSSQELYERQMALEMEEIEQNPEGEKKELVLIYLAKGIPEEQARQMAEKDMANPATAHEVLVKEELGISAEELKGSAMEAALTSFFLFAVGAVLPVLPFFWLEGNQAILVSVGLSVIGLFGIGAVITLFTGRSVWFSGMRQVGFGLAAAAITFFIGKWIGVSLAG